MKFEEALTALRAGEKIRHPSFADDEYLSGCYIGFPDYYDDDGKLVSETFEEKKERGMSIVKIKDDRQADIMYGKAKYVNKIKTRLKKILTDEEYKKYHNFHTDWCIADIFDNDIFIYPHLNLLLVMRDDWEIVK